MAFAGTNIDDILVLTLLLTQSRDRRGKMRIFLGYALGVAALAAVSILAGTGLRMVSGRWLRLMGLIPIALGVRAWFSEDDDAAPEGASVLAVALITVGNGADNLGVYIPLFAGFDSARIALAVPVFLMMTALWLVLGAKLSSLPALRNFIEVRCRAFVPAVYLLLGLYILIF